MKNILIYTISEFNFKCGGLVVQYELCRILHNMGLNVRLQAPKKIRNSIFNRYYNNEFDLNNTIVIYGETITNNPLNAPYVVRWILAPLGLCSDINIYKTWCPKDLVYYFNSEEKITSNSEKIGNIYKLLNIIYINPLITINNPNPRHGSCFTIRKYNKQKFVHPPKSFEITREHTQMDYIKIFNNHKYFICYDSLTFLAVIAALCGCIPIVIKVDSLSKQDWLATSCAIGYLKTSGENTLYGIAYGADDLENATKTLHLAKEQWNRIIAYNKDKYISSFINDINNWDNNINTIKNNYY